MDAIEKNLLIFTQTGLHAGSDSSVGAIDQPVQRERHTGLPVIHGSGIKGAIADFWNSELVADPNDKEKLIRAPKGEARWLFGSDDSHEPRAGVISFNEARLLAFPIRSAKGSFAWITSPTLLRRAARYGIILPEEIVELPSRGTSDRAAVFQKRDGVLAIRPNNQKGEQTTPYVVLEDYAFQHCDASEFDALSARLASALPEEPVWAEIKNRLVVLTDGMMSFFARSACEVSTHVRIDDETGTASEGGLFNIETVPSETLFYAPMIFRSEFRSPTDSEADTSGEKANSRDASQAVDAFRKNLSANQWIAQFGANASVGLGYCSLRLADHISKTQ